MNVLPKGMLTAVVATVIASVLILFTGNSVADSSNEKANNVDITKAEMVVSDDMSNQAAIAVVQIEAPSKIVASVTSNTADAAKVSTGNKMKLPPPGPFQFVDKESEPQVSVDSPKAPTSQTLEAATPSKPKLELALTKQPMLAAPIPKLGISQPKMISSAGVVPASSSMPEKVVVPEFKMTIPSIPTVNAKAPVSPTIEQAAPTFTRPNMNVQQFMPNQPIWTQTAPAFSGGVPNFHGMAPQMPRQMQNAPRRGQGIMAPTQNNPRNMQQGMNMRQGQQQQYMYVPVYPPVFYYPQMPRYNNYPRNMNNFMPRGYQQGGSMMGMRNNYHPRVQKNPKQNTGVKTQ